MGSSPKVPQYSQSGAIKEQNRVNLATAFQKYADVYGPNGGYTTYVDPATGQLTVNKVLSDNSMTALGQQRAVLGNYTGDGTDAANAYYNAQMAYAQPKLERQVTRGRTALTNRGIPLGGNAWNEYMGDIYDTQNQYKSNLANSAISAGQGYQSGILNQGNMLGAQVVDPEMVLGQGGAGLKDTYDTEFQNKLAAYKTAMAGSNVHKTVLGGLGTGVGAVLGGWIGGWANPAAYALGGTIGGAAGEAAGTVIDNN